MCDMDGNVYNDDDNDNYDDALATSLNVFDSLLNTYVKALPPFFLCFYTRNKVFSFHFIPFHSIRFNVHGIFVRSCSHA